MTLIEMCQKCKKELGNEQEANEICAFILNIDRRRIFENSQMQVLENQQNDIEKLIKLRLDGKPLAYILGEWEFYSLTFKLDENVLIPRADTETLVDRALEYLKNKDKAKVLDICAGSGCVGIAIGVNNKKCEITACDISKKAIEIAKYNAKNNQIEYNIIEDDVLNNKINYQQVDLIVSNPPYIKSQDINKLDVDVKDFEPLLALDGGQDGLIFYRKICENYLKYLKPNGKIIFEIGIDQHEEVFQIMKEHGLEQIELTRDLCQINRTIEAYKV